MCQRRRDVYREKTLAVINTRRISVGSCYFQGALEMAMGRKSNAFHSKKNAYIVEK